MSPQGPPDTPGPHARLGRCIYVLATLVALATVLGSLALSIALELRACPLCFYQRSFALAALGALVLGLLVSGPGARPTALATALLCATAGLGVAGFHVSLEARRALECPGGLLGIGSAPVQSLAALAALFAIVALGAFAGPGRRAGVAALLVGGLFSIASIWSSPPLPPAPQAPYTTALDICRPPYVP